MKTATVGELITMLRGMPPELPVHLEGCDCINKATRPIVVDDPNDDAYVLIGVDLPMSGVGDETTEDGL